MARLFSSPKSLVVAVIFQPFRGLVKVRHDTLLTYLPPDTHPSSTRTVGEGFTPSRSTGGDQPRPYECVMTGR